MPVPESPKIYHIVHLDRLPSIMKERALLCDAEVVRRSLGGTTIGMSLIRKRRLQELRLASHTDLLVRNCVPFDFCPRSVMLYLISRSNNPDLAYRLGQQQILHLKADLQQTVASADQQRLRWVFTLSHATARYFEDRCDLQHLAQIDWNAVQPNWYS